MSPAPVAEKYRDFRLYGGGSGILTSGINIVKLGSRPCPGQVQMTTMSTETQPLSQVTKSGPDA